MNPPTSPTPPSFPKRPFTSRLLALAGLLILLLGQTGCASLYSVSGWPPDDAQVISPYPRAIYGGVRTDARLLGACVGLSRIENDKPGHATKRALLTPAVLLDLPLSAALDTLVLPYTISFSPERAAYYRQMEPRPSRPRRRPPAATDPP